MTYTEKFTCISVAEFQSTTEVHLSGHQMINGFASRLYLNMDKESGSEFIPGEAYALSIRKVDKEAEEFFESQTNQ